jgi:hypothetical protein
MVVVTNMINYIRFQECIRDRGSKESTVVCFSVKSWVFLRDASLSFRGHEFYYRFYMLLMHRSAAR